MYNLSELKEAKTPKQWELMTEKELIEEYNKCSVCPQYFIRNYIFVEHPRRGLVLFDLYGFQVYIIDCLLTKRFNILRKFRQAGCTTIACAFALWRSVFKEYQKTVILSIGDTESTEVLDRIQVMYDELPPFLQPIATLKNRHTLKLETHSIIKSRPSSRATGRGLSGSFLILDEAAFIEKASTIWGAAYPILSTGGSAFILSTVNGMGGVGGFYYQMYNDAVAGLNTFNAMDIHWTQHPEYNRTKGYEHLYEEMAANDPPIDVDEWEEITRKNVGQRLWLQEFMCQFLGTGETFIDGETLIHMDKHVDMNFSREYNNRLYVWGEPKPYYEYVLVADPALGAGRDFSAFQVINLYTLNQEAEFYSNKTPIEEFCDIIAEVGNRYNIAHVSWENNAGFGENVKYHLFNRLEYENLYMDDKGKFGYTITSKLRNSVLAELEEYLRTEKIKIKSKRTLEELYVFIVTETGKIEADSSQHDDLVMSLALAVHLVIEIRECTPGFSAEPNQYPEEPLAMLVNKDAYKKIISTGGGDIITIEDYTWILNG